MHGASVGAGDRGLRGPLVHLDHSLSSSHSVTPSLFHSLLLSRFLYLSISLLLPPPLSLSPSLCLSLYLSISPSPSSFTFSPPRSILVPCTITLLAPLSFSPSSCPLFPLSGVSGEPFCVLTCPFSKLCQLWRGI